MWRKLHIFLPSSSTSQAAAAAAAVGGGVAVVVVGARRYPLGGRAVQCSVGLLFVHVCLWEVCLEFLVSRGLEVNGYGGSGLPSSIDAFFAGVIAVATWREVDCNKRSQSSTPLMM